MKKRLPILALCLVLLMSALLLGACETKRPLEETYELLMTSSGNNAPIWWRVRLNLEVDTRTKRVENVTWVPIMENGKDITYVGSQPGEYFNDIEKREAFLRTLSGTSFSSYKGLTAIKHFDDVSAPNDHLMQFEISTAASQPKVSIAFVIDAISYILKQHRYIL